MDVDHDGITAPPASHVNYFSYTIFDYRLLTRSNFNRPGLIPDT